MVDTSCEHQICAANETVWLPTSFQNDSDVERHIFCVHCGTIQNRSDDQAKPLGHWMNVLGFISKQIKITKVQKHLIAKEMRSCDYLKDTFGTFGSSQLALFLSIVSKYCDINRIDLDEIR
ncbi:MAG: hypothetical protein KGY50_03975 [Candidatus Thermoplasmatota archaeon]|nr:hypothetical protein [Candidatus Thermoplasmatota archaeon]